MALHLQREASTYEPRAPAPGLTSQPGEEEEARRHYVHTWGMRQERHTPLPLRFCWSEPKHVATLRPKAAWETYHLAGLPYTQLELYFHRRMATEGSLSFDISTDFELIKMYVLDAVSFGLGEKKTHY